MSSLLEQQFRSKWTVWAALGAGCLVGVSGLLLVQRLALRIEQTSSQGISHELASLHSTIKELQKEIRQIKKPPLKSALRPTVTFSDVKESLEDKEILTLSASSSTLTSTTEYYSAISSDDEEFFDLPSDGNATPTNEILNSNGLVEQALERLENELIEDPEDKQLRLLFR